MTRSEAIKAFFFKSVLPVIVALILYGLVCCIAPGHINLIQSSHLIDTFNLIDHSLFIFIQIHYPSPFKMGMKKRHRITHGVYMEKGMLYHQKNSIPFAFYVKFFSIVWRQITQISKVVNW